MKREEKQLYSANSAAEALDVSRGMIYKWMAAGQLKWVIIGTDRRIPATEIKRVAEYGIAAN
jgi:excisionase family DNA binding protein